VNENVHDLAKDTTDQELTVYMARYNSLRTEVFQRFQFQGQAYNFLIVVLSALLAVGAAQFQAGRGDVVDALSLFVPLIIGPFAFVYLAQELVIFSILAYIHGDLSRDVSRLLDRSVELGDSRFEHLTGEGRFIHRIIAPGRWLPFLFFTATPVVYAAFFTDLWNDFPLSLVFALDCLVVVALLATMIIATREEGAWRRQLTEDASPVTPEASAQP
jgi:hypothetical protein